MAVATRAVKTYGTVERTANGSWRIDAIPHVLIRLKRLFPRVRANRAGEIVIAGTTEIARDLEWVLERWPMEMDGADRQALADASREHVETELLAEEILAGKVPDIPLSWDAKNDQGETPHEDQLIAANLALATGRLLVADDLGMGKSLTGLLTLRRREKLPALIVCQTHLPKQWLEQLTEWTPLCGHIGRKGTPYKIADFNDGRPPDVLILPYSKLAGWSKALRGRVAVVIFDEVQELRRAGSQKFAAAGEIADHADLVIGLTATPVYNYGEEVFNIYSIVAPDALGTREEFIREWGASYGNHVGVRDPAALSHWLRDQNLLLRRSWKDRGVDRPKPRRIPHSIESDEEALKTLTIDAVQMAELLVTRQASRKELFKMSGEFDWKLRRATGIAKAGYVADFVKLLIEQGEQVLLFGWHHDVYEVWANRLGKYNPAFYTGKESPNKKQRSKDSFLAGDSRVLIMSLRSGAGVDGLQKASHICVFGELDWSPGMHDQCIGRLNRGQQENVVLAYFLISDGGADPLMADVLNLKRQQSEPILDPTIELVEGAGPGDRVRMLASDFLARRDDGS